MRGIKIKHIQECKLKISELQDYYKIPAIFNHNIDKEHRIIFSNSIRKEKFILETKDITKCILNQNKTNPKPEIKIKTVKLYIK